MIYGTIRSKIMKNDMLFKFIRFFYSPIRKTKEHFARRKMAMEIIEKNSKVNPSSLKVYYFGIPEHNNMGDIAQTYCTFQWIKHNYPERVLIPVRTRATFDRKFIGFMEANHNDQDIIVFQSGYCTRHNNPDHKMHLNIAKRFPDYKMIILPQTVKINDDNDIKITKSIFEKANLLTFIARDTLSFEYAKRFVPKDKLECFPDIVTSLIGRMHIYNNRNGVLLCLRNDDEKYYSDKDLKVLKQKFEEQRLSVDVADTNSDKSIEEIYEHLEEEVKSIITQFGKYKCVVTDRYHGTIFSLVANTPVIVIKTNDHKVTSAVGWFEGLYNDDSIHVANSLDQAFEYAIGIIYRSPIIKNSDILYREYYEKKLKNIFDR